MASVRSPAERAFRNSLWFQALAAGAALALSSPAGVVSTAAQGPAPLFALIFAGALAGVVFSIAETHLSRTAESVIALAAFAFVPVDLLALHTELAPALSRFLLILQLAKLLGPREARDEATILMVALVHVAVAASSTVELTFAPLVVLWALGATRTLALRELRTGIAGAPPSDAPVPRGFKNALLGLTLASLVVATAIFYVLPRYGAKLFPGLSGPTAERFSGYSDSLQLDDAGRIKESNVVVFRADVQKRGKLPAVPLWRGQAIDRYNGKEWKPSPPHERFGHEFNRDRGYYDLEIGDPPSDATVVEVHLEPGLRSETLFTPGIAYQVDFKTAGPPLVKRDAFGSIQRMWQGDGSPAIYTLTCVPTETYPKDYVNRVTHDGSKVGPEKVRRKCLELPTISLDVPRLRAYALDVLKKAGTPEDAPDEVKARALEEHLGNQTLFHYTLDSRRTPGVERVMDFLFTTKEGHCEIFASALVCLLRSIGVPARVVNGFKGGDYHSISDSYIVRSKHAHAWVEALGRDGWIVCDPTPPAEDAGRVAGVLSTLEDVRVWLEIRWFKNVIAYDDHEQRTTMRGLSSRIAPALDRWRDFLSRVREALAMDSRSELGAALWILALCLITGTTVATVGRKRVVDWLAETWAGLVATLGGRARAATPGSRELALVVAALEKRGVHRARGETARELLERAGSELGVEARAALDPLVPIYWSARWGGRALSEPERQAFVAAAQSLAKT